MNKQLTYLIICLIAFFFVTCKKTKLDGDYSKLVGTWHWTGGWSDEGSADLKLDLKERGKYKLYKGNKKIEYGRLLKDGEYLKFLSDNFIKKVGQQRLFLNQKLIYYYTDTTLFVVQCVNCNDGSSSGFAKD